MVSDPVDDSSGVVEVEFRTTDTAYPLTELSAQINCRVRLEQFMPGKGSGYYSYYQISGEPPDRIEAHLQDYSGLAARLIHAGDNIGLFELEIQNDDEYFAPLVTEAGALLSQMWAVDGESHLLVHVPATTSPNAVIEAVLDRHPRMRVIAKRRRQYTAPLFSQELFRTAVEEKLTDRQLEVLMTAYSKGYFETPRETSGQAIAAKMGISQATFSEHLRTAQRRILAILF